MNAGFVGVGARGNPMGLAQHRDLPMPLFDQLDQLIGFPHWHDARDPLYTRKIEFLRRTLKTASPGKATR